MTKQMLKNVDLVGDFNCCLFNDDDHEYPRLTNPDACVWDGNVSTASDTQRGYAPRIGIEKQASLGFAGNNSWLPRQKMDMSRGSNFKKGGTGHTNKGCHLTFFRRWPMLY